MKRTLLILFFYAVFFSANGQGKTFLDEPYIDVTGSADTLVIPDEIFIRIELSEKDSRDRISLEELESRLATGLKNIGIDVEKDLSASDIYSNLRYSLLKGKDVIKSKQYSLKVSNAATASKVFVQLEQMGISNASVERVSHSQAESIKLSLSAIAAANARTKANTIAKQLNKLTGDVVFISELEGFGNFSYPYAQYQYERVGYAYKQKQQTESSEIEFNKLKISVKLNVKFKLD